MGMRRIAKTVIQLVSALWLLGTGFALAATPQEYLSNAHEFLGKGEVKAAVIELKNALRADPALVEARLLLGEIYVRLGDGASAEKELSRAVQLGSPETRWQRPLGEAYLLQRKFNSVLDELDVDPESPEDMQASVFTLRGQAYLGLRRIEEAEKALANALALMPDFEPALISTIRLKIAGKELEQAAKAVDELLEKSPQNTAGLLIRAELYRQFGQHEEAVKTFSKLLRIYPEQQRARLGRAAALTALGKADEALADLNTIERDNKVPMVQYLRAVIAFQKRDTRAAAEHLELVLGAVPNHVQSLFLYGVANYALGQYETADQYLSRAVKALPGNVQALKLFAATKMKLRQPKDAITALEPVVSQSDDPQLLALLGSAYMADGNHSKGAEILALAVEKAPNLASLRAQLALGLLAEGETDQAISELKSAVDLGQELLQADVLLVLTHLREKNYTEALKVSRALEQRMPDNAIPYNLTGLTLMAKKEYGGAAEKFRKALKIDSSFLTAKMNLARLAVMQGDFKKAEQDYRSILKQSNSNLGAQLGLAGLAEKRGERAEVENWLKQAQKTNPEAIEPSLLLLEFYLQSGDRLKALRIANELFGKFPNNGRVMQALGTAQLAAGEAHSAVRSFKSLIDKEGASPQLLVLLARAQETAGDLPGARESYEKVIAQAPENNRLKLALGSMELRAKRFTQALDIAKEVQQADPKLSAAYDLEGATHLVNKQPTQALEAYAKAHSLRPTSQRVILLSRLHGQTRDLEKATSVLQQWMDQHPDDLAVGTSLAMTYQSRGMKNRALMAYENVYRNDQDNILVLNNLAWLYFEKGDARALELARKAYDKMPERPEVVDTYGWILLKSGKLEKALIILQQAMVSAPDKPDIGFHVAVAMDKVGRTDEARKLLRRVLKAHPRFSEVDKAKALLKRLGG